MGMVGVEMENKGSRRFMDGGSAQDMLYWKIPDSLENHRRC